MPAQFGEEDMPAHLAGDRGAHLVHHRLDVAVAAFPHHRAAAERGDAIEQRGACLDVRDDRGPGIGAKRRLGKDRQQLIARDHPAEAVDGANTVPVAVEGDPEVERLFHHQRLQRGKVGFFGRIGVMIGEAAVDLGEEHVMLAWQQPNEAFDRRPGRAVASIPADAKGGDRIAVDETSDIFLAHLGRADAAGTALDVAGSREAGEPDDVLAEERPVAQHHLEAVVVNRIVAAGDLDRPVDAQRPLCMVEHRGGAEADPHDMDTRGSEAFDQRRFQIRGGEASVPPDRDACAAAAPHDAAEGAADRARVRSVERATDGASNVIIAQDRGVETVLHGCRRPVSLNRLDEAEGLGLR